MFCERTDFCGGNGDKSSDTTIESTSLKHIKQIVPPALMEAAPMDKIALTNGHNVGKLGPNIHIQGYQQRNMKNNTIVTKICKADVLPTSTPNFDMQMGFKRYQRPNPPVNGPEVRAPIVDGRAAGFRREMTGGTLRTQDVPSNLQAQPDILKQSPHPKVYTKPQASSNEKPIRVIVKEPTKIIMHPPKPKPMGLQIQSVFSLSDGSCQNFI